MARFDKIQKIGREAIDYIYGKLTLLNKNIVVNDDDDFIVNAFDCDGEAYSFYAKEFGTTSLIDVDGNEVDYTDISSASVARIADYIDEYLEKHPITDAQILDKVISIVRCHFGWNPMTGKIDYAEDQASYDVISAWLEKKREELAGKTK